MKFKNKSIALLAVAVTISGLASAQEFKTDVSVSDQLKNNSAPGLKYKQAMVRAAL